MHSSDPALHFTLPDAFVLAGYLLVVLGIGWFAVRRQMGKGVTDYLLAGRSLTTPVFVMTLVSTWYGGILGVGEFTYSYGIANWVIQGVPYYIFAVVFAFLLAGKIRASKATTIPDRLHEVYDRRTALLGAGLTFFLMTPAPYVLMIGILLQMITGWSLLVCVVTGTMVTTVYLFAGGLRADIYTDVFEFLLMFGGFGLILPYAVSSYGGWEFLQSHVPPLHLTWDGGNSPQFILVWFFIALWTLVDPAFYQRCAAAASGTVARRGILWSVVFWMLFDAMTVTAGLYARAVLPPLDQPVMAYPLLAEHLLPPVAKGLFFVGLLATIMSSMNTLAFVSGTTLGRDIVLRIRRTRGADSAPEREGAGASTGDVWRNSPADHVHQQTEHGAGSTVREDVMRWNSERFWVQAGLLISGVLAMVLALLVPSVIKLWYTIGTVIVPGLLIPLVSSYFEKLRVDARTAFLAMLLGWLTSTVWLLAGWTRQIGVAEYYPWGIEPMIPGLTVSLVVWIVGRVVRR